MLYEVITMAEVDKVKAPTLLMIGAEDREMRRIATGRVAGRLKQLKTPIIHVEYVITSYSIHYTKLYDLIASAVPRAERGEFAGNGLFFELFRDCP